MKRSLRPLSILLAAAALAGCGSDDSPARSDAGASDADLAAPDVALDGASSDAGDRPDAATGPAGCAPVEQAFCLECPPEVVLQGAAGSLQGPIQPVEAYVYLLQGGDITRVARDGGPAESVLRTGEIVDFAWAPTRVVYVEAQATGGRALIQVARLAGTGGPQPTFGQPITLLDGLGDGWTSLTMRDGRVGLVFADSAEGSGIFVRDVSWDQGVRADAVSPLPMVLHRDDASAWIEGGDAPVLRAIGAEGADAQTVLSLALDGNFRPVAASASEARLFALGEAALWSAPLDATCPTGVCDAAAFEPGARLDAPPVRVAAEGDLVVWSDADAIRAWHPTCESAVVLTDAPGDLGGLALADGEVFWLTETALMRLPAAP